MLRNLLVLLAFMVVLGIFVYRIARGRSGTKLIGFREYVRNPKLRAEVPRSFAQRDQDAQLLANKDSSELVGMLLDENRFGIARRAIEFAGKRVIPELLKALSNPKFRQKTDSTKQENVHLLMRRSQPLVSVFECLEKLVAVEAVSAASQFMDDEDKEVRKHLALFVGTVGSDSAIPPLVRAMKDLDRFVRSYAIMGILRALKNDRVSAEFRSAIFEAVCPLTRQQDPHVNDDAPSCLLALDRKRAIRFLTEKESLSSQSRSLHHVLKALHEERIRLDENVLLGLVSELSENVETYPNAYVVGEALTSLGLHDSVAAQEAITSGLESPSSQIREKAAEALALRHGIENPYARLFDLLSKAGWDGLTVPQRIVIAVRILIDEVNNGGFSQYFVNSSGDQWELALDGIAAIGASADLRLFQEVLSKFGDKVPSTDGNTRHRQLAKAVKGNDGVFSSIESAFYENKDDREVRLLKYMIRYPSDFATKHEFSS